MGVGRDPPPRSCPFPSPDGSEAGTCIAAVLTPNTSCTPWCPMGLFYLWRDPSPRALCPTACRGRETAHKSALAPRPPRQGPASSSPTPTCRALEAPAWPQDHRPCGRKRPGRDLESPSVPPACPDPQQRPGLVPATEPCAARSCCHHAQLQPHPDVPLWGQMPYFRRLQHLGMAQELLSPQGTETRPHSQPAPPHHPWVPLTGWGLWWFSSALST